MGAIVRDEKGHFKKGATAKKPIEKEVVPSNDHENESFAKLAKAIEEEVKKQFGSQLPPNAKIEVTSIRRVTPEDICKEMDGLKIENENLRSVNEKLRSVIADLDKRGSNLSKMLHDNENRHLHELKAKDENLATLEYINTWLTKKIAHAKVAYFAVGFILGEICMMLLSAVVKHYGL